MAVRTGRPVASALAKARQTGGRKVLIDAYSTTKLSPYFEVIDLPLVVQLFDASMGQRIHVLTSAMVYGEVRDQAFRPQGVPVVLDAANNSILITRSGRYRVQLEGDIGDAVCICGPQLTADRVQDIRQPSGAHANRPNLFLKGSNKSHTIEIADTAWVLNAYGLLPGEFIQTLAVYGDGPTYREEPYVHNGAGKLLTPDNTAITLDVSGRYRFELYGDPTDKLLVGNPTILPAIGEGTTESIPGPMGPQGPQGIQGERGEDGQIRFTGMGPPPDIIVGSRPNDTYLDLITGDVYKLL